MSDPATDSIYYAHAGALPLVSRISLSARRRIYALFIARMNPSATAKILDIGVSGDTAALEANVLERLYPHPENITCAGLEDSESVAQTYPGVAFQRIRPHEPLPFPDKSFDIVYSNAVLEHAGSRERQSAFVREAQRVGRRVFIAAPNRWFPIEQHTGLPFLHYLPASVFRALLGWTPLRHWASEDNLNHMTAAELAALFTDPGRVRTEYVGFGWRPFASNLAAWT